jgi:nucleotide-binding universal stress UspA family protein
MQALSAAVAAEVISLQNLSKQLALDDFYAARRKAALQELLARFTHKPVGLFSYEEVRQKLKAQVGSERGLRDIPLAAIVGSVNRYEDFTCDFLPRQGIMGQRWANVKAAVEGSLGLPPIEVYQLGEAYFVKDGNHRVSVARQRGDATIQAYVTEVRSAVPFKPGDSPDDLILKGEYADFLAHTRFDELRPDARWQVTSPGQFAVLEEHIAVHRYFMGQQFQRAISPDEATIHWYDTVYLPVIRAIRQRQLLQEFPQRTETDLYLWLAEYQMQLKSELGMDVSPEAAATALAVEHSPRPERVAARLAGALIPAALEPGPPVGRWRQGKEGRQRYFENVLVALDEHGHYAREQALILARLEGARLNGLHVDTSGAGAFSPLAQSLRDDFERRCREENISATFKLMVSSSVTRKVIDHTHWHDLLLFTFTNPPLESSAVRKSFDVQRLLHQSAGPVMIVPHHVSSLTHALLVYDGSPKAREALFLAIYLVQKWEISLSVLTIPYQGRARKFDPSGMLRDVQEFLTRCQVAAKAVHASGPAATAILLTTETSHCDLIIMGGYGRGPLLKGFTDDVIDQVLRRANRPVLLCR